LVVKSKGGGKRGEGLKREGGELNNFLPLKRGAY